jgi:phosphohistidine phosphatase
MINLYLVRHSDAEKANPLKSDFERELTPEGKEAILKAALGWKKLVASFDIIASSPLIRAVQTAEIIAKTFSYKKKIFKDERLSTGCKPEGFLEAVKSLEGNNIVVIGHSPDLSIITSSLISSSGAFIDFKKAAIAKISFEGRIRLTKGMLEFLIPVESYK